MQLLIKFGSNLKLAAQTVISLLAQFLRVQRSNFNINLQETKGFKWPELCLKWLISLKTMIIRANFHCNSHNSESWLL